MNKQQVKGAANQAAARARKPTGVAATADGGYLIANLALPDAMRLLGGRNRRGGAAAKAARPTHRSDWTARRGKDRWRLR